MRKPVLAGVAFFLVLVGILVTLLLPRPSRVTRENSERIKEGMSRAEVEEILGGPPGDYRTKPTNLDRDAVARAILSVFFNAEWCGDEGEVWVSFGPDDKVRDMSFAEAGPVEVSTLALLRWRLNRRWDRLWGR
jgi:hypothetical protein